MSSLAGADPPEPRRTATAIDTCFVQRGSAPITPAASHLHGRRVEAVVDADSLLLRPGASGVPVTDGQAYIAQAHLEGLGWAPGTVVEVHREDDDVRLVRSSNALSSSYVTFDRGAAAPPGWLVQTVTGSPNVKAFVQSSYDLAKTIVRAAEPHIGDQATWRLLDFGCGCGRLARAMPLYRRCEVWGCDLQEAAIEWCRQWLVGTYFLGKEEPPLDLPDHGFDLLVAISVLTHLSEEHQDAWLAEWSRLLRPGGIALVTFRGRRFVSELFAERYPVERRAVLESQWADTGGIAYARSDFWTGVFPDYYGDTYHTEDYVRSHWGRFFDVREILPGSHDGAISQDTVVLLARG